MGRHLGGGIVRAIVPALMLAVGLAAFEVIGAGAGWLGGPTVAHAADPTATPGSAGDTRSAGEGPGLVGAPGLAILGVLGLGLGTALLTIVYVRLTEGRSERRDPRPEP